MLLLMCCLSVVGWIASFFYGYWWITLICAILCLGFAVWSSYGEYECLGTDTGSL